MAALAYCGTVIGAWTTIYVLGTVTQQQPCAVPADRLTPILSFLGAVIVAVIGAVVTLRQNGDPPRRRRRSRAEA